MIYSSGCCLAWFYFLFVKNTLSLVLTTWFYIWKKILWGNFLCWFCFKVWFYTSCRSLGSNPETSPCSCLFFEAPSWNCCSVAASRRLKGDKKTVVQPNSSGIIRNHQDSVWFLLGLAVRSQVGGQRLQSTLPEVRPTTRLCRLNAAVEKTARWLLSMPCAAIKWLGGFSPLRRRCKASRVCKHKAKWLGVQHFKSI